MGRGGGNAEGETGMGKRGGVEVLARAGSGEGEMGRVKLGGGMGQWEGGDGEGATGRGRQGRGQRGGEKKGHEERGFQMDMMKCLGGHVECLGGMRLQSFLTLFTRATPGTPASCFI